jgi:DNA processing protein
MSDESDEILTCLQLARTEGVGPVTFTGLLQRHHTLAAALRAVRQQPAPGGTTCRVPDRHLLLAELNALAELDALVLIKPRADYPAQSRRSLTARQR